MAAASATTLAQMSFKEFLGTHFENEHMEWVNGEVVPMAPVSDVHQHIAGFLISILRPFVEHGDLGVIMHEPFQMKLGQDLPSRAPDVLFISKKRLSRLKKVYLDGPADLVIEVISPGSAAIDRGEKFLDYEQGGVQEYWIIHPSKKRVEFFRRVKGAFRPVIADDEGFYTSGAIKGLWIKTDWLWRRPTVLEVLKTWKLT
jgi:Uma2 family endonuclease